MTMARTDRAIPSVNRWIGILALLFAVALTPGRGWGAEDEGEPIPWPRYMVLTFPAYTAPGESLMGYFTLPEAGGGDMERGPELPDNSILTFGDSWTGIHGLFLAGCCVILKDGQPAWVAPDRDTALALLERRLADPEASPSNGFHVTRTGPGRVASEAVKTRNTTTGHPDYRPVTVLERRRSTLDALTDGPGFRMASTNDDEVTYRETGAHWFTRPMTNGRFDIRLRAVAREPVQGQDVWRYKIEARVDGRSAYVNGATLDYNIGHNQRSVGPNPRGGIWLETFKTVTETVYFLGYAIPDGADEGAPWFQGAHLTVDAAHDDGVRRDVERLDEQAATIAGSIKARKYDLAARQIASIKASLADLSAEGVAWRWHAYPTQGGVDRYQGAMAATETLLQTYVEVFRQKQAIETRLNELRGKLTCTVFTGMVSNALSWTNVIPTDPFAGLAGYSQFTGVLALTKTLLDWKAQAEADAACLAEQFETLRALERLQADLQAYFDRLFAARKEALRTIAETDDKRALDLHAMLTDA
jgi:hypothetical protein